MEATFCATPRMCSAPSLSDWATRRGRAGVVCLGRPIVLVRASIRSVQQPLGTTMEAETRGPRRADPIGIATVRRAATSHPPTYSVVEPNRGVGE